MKHFQLLIVLSLLGSLTACQEQPRSSEYYRANLEEARKDEQKCQQMRQAGKEPNEVLAKNCSIAHDVLPVSYTHLTLPTNREV